MDTSTNNEYETHDIYLAAYLMVSGCDLVRRRRQGARVYFVFQNKAGPIEELREAYYSGRAKVVAIRFAQEIISMKQLTAH